MKNMIIVLLFSLNYLISIDAMCSELNPLSALKKTLATRIISGPNFESWQHFPEPFLDQRFLFPEQYSYENFTYSLNFKNIPKVNSAEFEINSILDQVAGTIQGNEMLEILKNNGIGALKLVLVYHPHRYHYVDSWTDRKLHTYIFLNDKNINSLHLFKVLVHELAQIVNNDDLSKFLPLLQSVKSKVFENSCTPENLFSNVQFRLLVSTLRAFNVERIALNNTKSKSLSCLNRLQSVFLSLQQYELTLSQEYSQWGQTTKLNCHTADLANQFVKDLSISSNGESVCIELEKPNFSEIINLNKTFGPRPNIGGGGGI